jgi:manganese/zinc/iron transport system permease protein
MSLEWSYNLGIVLLGSALLCAMSAFVGTFAVLRKRGLLGDVIAHSVLPGIALAFLLTVEKNPFYLFVGASITGWISTITVDMITKYSKIKSDAAIALTLSFFFGAGVVLLTYIQHLGLPEQSGLETFLFGQAAAIGKQQVVFFSMVGGIILSVGLLFKRSFMLFSFDEEYAEAIGWPVRLIRWTLSVLTVAAVALGVQAVGVVLMAALLITPAAGARFFTASLNKMLALSVLFGVVSGVFGAIFSAMRSGLSTGPVVVIFLTFFTVLSILFGPNKGLLKKWQIRRRNQLKIHRDHVLKSFYYYQQEHGEGAIDKKHLIQSGGLRSTELDKGINELRKEGLISGSKHLRLTDEGQHASKEIIRKHRLWELFLSTHFKLDSDHVHQDAEGIEHLITPEIEARLMEELNQPDKDPHDKEIPYE